MFDHMSLTRLQAREPTAQRCVHSDDANGRWVEKRGSSNACTLTVGCGSSMAVELHSELQQGPGSLGCARGKHGTRDGLPAQKVPARAALSRQCIFIMVPDQTRPRPPTLQVSHSEVRVAV
eukprot:5287139-Prymnesium_polylepis.3